MATAQDIQGLYGLLGRAPDQAGLDYWTKQANSGMSMDAIRQSFQNVASAGTDPLKPANPLIPANNLGSIGITDQQWQAYNSPGGSGYTAPTPATAPNPLLTTPQAATPNPSIPTGLPARDPALLSTAQTLGNQIRDTNAGAGSPLMAQYQTALDNMVYGTAPTGVTPQITEALSRVYQNEFARAPDQAGLDYWTNEYTSGRQTLQQIEANIRAGDEAKAREFRVYQDNPLFAGNEWTPQALAGSGLAQMGLSYMQPSNGAPFDTASPISPTNQPRTVEDWTKYNTNLGTPAQQNTDYAAYTDYANNAYAGMRTNPLVPPAPAVTRPAPSAQVSPSAPTAPLTTRPPTRFASDYNYASPMDRQLAAANDQRATPMTQPVGFASDNPLLNRFGTARLGEYTGARETPGNVPGPYTPRNNPLSGPASTAAGALATDSNTGTVNNATTPSPVISEQASAIARAVPGLVGLAGPQLESAIRAIPGGATVLSAFGANPGDLSDLSFNAGGQLLRNGVVVPPDPTTFAGRFNSALKPGWMNVGSAAFAALPDILNGNYTKAAGAGLGAYAGTAIGSAIAAGIGSGLGNLVIPGLGGLIGTFIGRKIGGLFGNGQSVGPNAGQSMRIGADGKLVPGDSGGDNSGGSQESFVNQFMSGVAEVVNHASSETGGKFRPLPDARPLYVDVVNGKINVYGEDGPTSIKSFNGDQIKEAFAYAVDKATRYHGFQRAA